MANRLFNVIGWLGTALVLGAVGIRFGIPAQDRYATYLAWGGLVCMLLYILSQWREIAGVFSRRQARYGTLAASSVLIVLGILIAINYIGKRQNKRWDLTAAQQFSLSDQSRNVLANLDAPLNIAVYVQETAFQEYRDRLQEYGYLSKQVKTEYIDPDKQRAVAQQNQIQQYGTIVFNYKGRTERVTMNSEQDITNGIIKVVSGQTKKVYFTQGHGEKDTVSTEREGYETMTQSLGRENYTVEKLVLAQASSVPDDATVVVIAGPRNDFFPAEIAALSAYLGKNGKLLLMLDPPDRAGAAPLTNLIALAHDWGVDVGNDIVVDVSGMGQLFGASEAVPVAANYPPHPITERFNNIMTVYPLARSITPVEGGANGRTARPVVQTSDRSWAESDLEALMASKPAGLDPAAGDKPGPITLASAVSAPAAAPTPPAAPEPDGAPRPEARVVVFGDSDFPSNATLGVPGNSDLFLNVIGWLSQQENLISIRAREASDRRLTLTATQQNNIVWLSLLLVPALVFGTGIYSWWQRR